MLNITLDHTWVIGVINLLLLLYLSTISTILLMRQRVVKSELEAHDRKARKWSWRNNPDDKKLTMVGSVELEEKGNNDITRKRN